MIPSMIPLENILDSLGVTEKVVGAIMARLPLALLKKAVCVAVFDDTGSGTFYQRQRKGAKGRGTYAPLVLYSKAAN